RSTPPRSPAATAAPCRTGTSRPFSGGTTHDTLRAMSDSIPRLRRQGRATQLIVGDAPLLILGGELGNSTASSRPHLDAAWPRLRALHINTALVPVYWELCEPEEGHFDFGLVDHAIQGARRHGLRLVLLWFGSWKNSMSSYVPAWVKADQARFP